MQKPRERNLHVSSQRSEQEVTPAQPRAEVDSDKSRFQEADRFDPWKKRKDRRSGWHDPWAST